MHGIRPRKGRQWRGAHRYRHDTWDESSDWQPAQRTWFGLSRLEISGFELSWMVDRSVVAEEVISRAIGNQAFFPPLFEYTASHSYWTWTGIVDVASVVDPRVRLPTRL